MCRGIVPEILERREGDDPHEGSIVPFWDLRKRAPREGGEAWLRRDRRTDVHEATSGHLFDPEKMPLRRRPGKSIVELPVGRDHSRFFGHRQGEVQAVVERLARLLPNFPCKRNNSTVPM